MPEAKHCWQLDVHLKPTPCFLIAGGTPCSNVDCAVDQDVQETLMSGRVTSMRVELPFLLHSHCRMSSFSEDNAEYLERTGGGEIQ